MKRSIFVRIKVSEYYKNELFKYMHEDMFDILAEAYCYRKTSVKVPDYLIDDFNKNRAHK